MSSRRPWRSHLPPSSRYSSSSYVASSSYTSNRYATGSSALSSYTHRATSSYRPSSSHVHNSSTDTTAGAGASFRDQHHWSTTASTNRPPRLPLRDHNHEHATTTTITSEPVEQTFVASKYLWSKKDMDLQLKQAKTEVTVASVRTTCPSYDTLPLDVLARIVGFMVLVKDKCALRLVSRRFLAAVESSEAWSNITDWRLDVRTVTTTTSAPDANFVCNLQFNQQQKMRLVGPLDTELGDSVFGYPLDQLIEWLTHVQHLHITAEYEALSTLLLSMCDCFAGRYLTDVYLCARCSPQSGAQAVCMFIERFVANRHCNGVPVKLSLRLEPYWENVHDEDASLQQYDAPEILKAVNDRCRPMDVLEGFELHAIQPYDVNQLFDVFNNRFLRKLSFEMYLLPDNSVLGALLDCLADGSLEILEITQLNFQPAIDFVDLLANISPTCVERVHTLTLCVQRCLNENMLDWLMLLPSLFPNLQRFTCRSHAHLPLDGLDLIMFVGHWLHFYQNTELHIKSLPMMSGLHVIDLLAPLGVQIVDRQWVQPNYRLKLTLTAPGSGTMHVELVYTTAQDEGAIVGHGGAAGGLFDELVDLEEL